MTSIPAGDVIRDSSFFIYKSFNQGDASCFSLEASPFFYFIFLADYRRNSANIKRCMQFFIPKNSCLIVIPAQAGFRYQRLG